MSKKPTDNTGISTKPTSTNQTPDVCIVSLIICSTDQSILINASIPTENYGEQDAFYRTGTLMCEIYDCHSMRTLSQSESEDSVRSRNWIIERRSSSANPHEHWHSEITNKYWNMKIAQMNHATLHPHRACLNVHECKHHLMNKHGPMKKERNRIIGLCVRLVCEHL